MVGWEDDTSYCRPYGNEKMLEIERRSTRSYLVEKSLLQRL